MNTYNVTGSEERGFKVQGYPTGRTSNTVETRTTKDRAEAQRWADSMNQGIDPPEAGVASYADD